MDLSQCKLLKEDDAGYEISYPSGKSFSLDKKGLSEKAHALIQGLKAQKEEVPHMKSGGAVGDEMPMVDEVLPEIPIAKPDGQWDITRDIKQTAQEHNWPTILGGPEKPLAPNGVQDPKLHVVGTPVPASVSPQGDVPPPVQVPQQNPMADLSVMKHGALETQAGQINDYLKAQKQGFAQQQTAYKNYEANLAKDQAEFQMRQADYKAKDDALSKAFNEKQVDPNRYWASQSTGSKVAAGIGMLLSGFGSAVAGQENLAQKYLTKAIDDDIDAQKNDQTKSMNLYKMNREALGDDQKAHLATQNQMLTALQAKINMSTAGLQGSKAQLEGQSMLNQIEQQKAENRMRFGILNQQEAMGGSSGGAPQRGIAADPALLVPMYIKDEGQQKLAYDEINKAKEASKTRLQMIGLMRKAHDEWRSGVREPVAIGELENLAIPLIRDQAGRVSEFEHDAFKKLLSGRWDTDARFEQKLKGMTDMWDARLQSSLTKGASGGVIDLSKFASTMTPQEIVKKKSGGFTYVKVPGGWKKEQ